MKLVVKNADFSSCRIGKYIDASNFVFNVFNRANVNASGYVRGDAYFATDAIPVYGDFSIEGLNIERVIFLNNQREVINNRVYYTINEEVLETAAYIILTGSKANNPGVIDNNGNYVKGTLSMHRNTADAMTEIPLLFSSINEYDYPSDTVISTDYITINSFIFHDGIKNIQAIRCYDSNKELLTTIAATNITYDPYWFGSYKTVLDGAKFIKISVNREGNTIIGDGDNQRIEGASFITGAAI